MSGDKTTQVRPTIYDVANLAGVSKTLVSRVLGGKSGVSAENRAAIVQAIESLGYIPSRAASALAGSRTKTIGVVIHDFSNQWFIDLIDGMREVLDQRGYQVAVADIRYGEGAHTHPVDGFIATHVEGIVIAAEPDDAAGRLQIPVSVAGTRLHVPENADSIAGDDSVGGRLATQHLIDLGHSHIAHLTGGGGPAANRRRAYVETMTEAGLQPVLEGFEGPDGSTGEADGYRAAGLLLDEHPETTAIFAANDVMALGAMGALRERGCSIPGDVSIVGYDNSPLAATKYLSLSSVDDMSHEVGQSTARALLARIDDAEATRQYIRIPPVFVDRGSTAPPRTQHPS
jgi:DNA-binding LacI/PurR family transcriptional regulator